jgi:hypothetical protein
MRQLLTSYSPSRPIDFAIMDSAKHCPNCGTRLLLYYVPGFVPSVGVIGGGEQSMQIVPTALLTGCLYILCLPAIEFWNLPSSSVLAVCTGLAIALLLLRQEKRRHKETSEHGRYYCEKCDRRFEGDALAPFTK